MWSPFITRRRTCIMMKVVYAVLANSSKYKYNLLPLLPSFKYIFRSLSQFSKGYAFEYIANKRRRRKKGGKINFLLKLRARKGKRVIAVNRQTQFEMSRYDTLWHTRQPNLTALICEFIGVAGRDTRPLHVPQLRHLRINSGFVPIKENRAF